MSGAHQSKKVQAKGLEMRAHKSKMASSEAAHDSPPSIPSEHKAAAEAEPATASPEGASVATGEESPEVHGRECR